MEDSEQLFRTTRMNLLSFANSLLRNPEDAQDVVQDVFRECLETRPAKLNRSYLFTAVRNRSLNKIRNTHRLRRAMDRFSEFLHLFNEDGPQDSLGLLTQFKDLPEAQREILILRIKGGLNINEIAEVLGIPEGTVKSRINRALKTLRKNIRSEL